MGWMKVKHPPIRVYPLMLLAAKHANFGGAIRLYFAAKHIDQDGRGWVNVEDLKEYLSGFGVSDRTVRNWISDALDLGLLERWHDENNLFNLIGLARTAAILGLDRLDKCPVNIPGKKLFKSGWHLSAWSGYIKANHQNQRASQETLYKLTGVPVSTQRLWNQKAKVIRRRAVAVSNIPGDHLDGVREYNDQRRASPFIFNDPAQAGKGEVYKPVIAWHIPSRNRATDRTIQLATHGRSRTVKHALKSDRLQRLSKVAIIPICKTLGQVQIVRRLFCDNGGEYKATTNQRRKDSDQADIYLLRRWKRINSALEVYSVC
jgi:hypothetical protein